MGYMRHENVGKPMKYSQKLCITH